MTLNELMGPMLLNFWSVIYKVSNIVECFLDLVLTNMPWTNTSLLPKLVNYGYKLFYNIGPWGSPDIHIYNFCILG